MRHLFLRAKFKALRHLAMWRYRMAIGKTLPIPVGGAGGSPVAAAMLCGRSTLYKGLGAAKSFFRFLPEGIPFRWHDDGSLTDQDIDVIRHHLPGVLVIRRHDADYKVQGYLEENGFHELAALRKRFVLTLKLVDAAFFAAPGRLIQFDSDVLCLQPPKALVDAIQREDFHSRYNRDFGPALAYRETDLENFLGRPVLSCFNAGLFLTAVPNFHEFCAFAERLLASGLENLRPWVLEQTLWAAWCTQQGGEALPEEYDCTFRFGKESTSARARVVTQHYCAFSSAMFFTDFIAKVYPELAPPDFVSRVLLESIRTGELKIA